MLSSLELELIECIVRERLNSCANHVDVSSLSAIANTINSLGHHKALWVISRIELILVVVAHVVRIDILQQLSSLFTNLDSLVLSTTCVLNVLNRLLELLCQLLEVELGLCAEACRVEIVDSNVSVSLVETVGVGLGLLCWEHIRSLALEESPVDEVVRRLHIRE